MTKKKQVGVRFDSNRTRLKTGETQRPNGTYAYRWSTPEGKRHSIYAPTLEKLREQEEQIIVDKHDGIRSDVKSITVNEMFDLWCQLKRGIKDSTFKNYIYMYTDSEKDVQVLRERFLEWKYRNACKLNGKY